MSPYASVAAAAVPAAAVPAPRSYSPARVDHSAAPGGEAALGVRASVWGTIVGTITTGLGIGASLMPPAPPHAFVRSVAAGMVTGVASAVLIRALADGADVPFLPSVHATAAGPGGAPDYARLDALAATGDLAGALAGYEAIVRADPGEATARLQAAELHILAGNAVRAETLLREVQRHPARTDAHDLRASNRLVDLYLGPLAAPEKALHELARLADARAGTVVGDGAREAIGRILGRSLSSSGSDRGS